MKRRRETRATGGWKCLLRRTGNPSVEGGDTYTAAVKTWGHTDKKENKFSSYIRKFRVVQLQSHL